MDDLVKYWLNTAMERLASSNILLEAGQYKDSIARLHYAIFAVIRAILALNAIDFSKSAGAIAFFKMNKDSYLLGYGFFYVPKIYFKLF